jgi:hypothetical protein
MSEQDSAEMEKNRRDAAEALMMSAIGGGPVAPRPTAAASTVGSVPNSSTTTLLNAGEARDGDTTESENDEDEPSSPPKVVDVPAKPPSLAVPMDPVMAAAQDNFGGKPPRPNKATPGRRQVRKQLPTAAKRQLERQESAQSAQEAVLLGLLSKDEPSAKRAKLDTDAVAINQMDPADYLNNAVRLEYDWKELKLGEEVGTAALNRYLKSQHSDPRRAPELTAQQTLQIAMSLRPRTILPPKGSILHRVMQKVRKLAMIRECVATRNVKLTGPFRINTQAPELDILDTPGLRLQQESEDAAAFLRAIFRSLSHTYQFLCEQDSDDDELFRREADYLRDAALLEQLRLLENEVCDSKAREDTILRRATELGLVDPRRVADIMAGQLYVHSEKQPEPVLNSPATPSSDDKTTDI